MNQQQFLTIPRPEIKKSEDGARHKEPKEEMVKIPVFGTIDSKTGKITFYKKNEKT